MNKTPTKKKFLHKQYWHNEETFIERAPFTISLFKGNNCIKISKKHKGYMGDIISEFDFYFGSVEAENKENYQLVDFSKIKAHKVYGYDLHKLMFPAFSEPISTTQQYLNFANLSNDSIVLDLGAYSGLSSIIFDSKISELDKNTTGKVIAVDPGVQNRKCITYNFEAYRAQTGRKIEYLNAAAWNNDEQIEFLSDGNLGASAAKIITRRAKTVKVNAHKLSTIAKMYDLEKVDFIKCDIEGAEIYIFEDKEFFQKYTPRIIIECHAINCDKNIAAETVMKTLSQFGYTFNKIEQAGSEMPLLQCTPPKNKD